MGALKISLACVLFLRRTFSFFFVLVFFFQGRYFSLCTSGFLEITMWTRLALNSESLPMPPKRWH